MKNHSLTRTNTRNLISLQTFNIGYITNLMANEWMLHGEYYNGYNNLYEKSYTNVILLFISICDILQNLREEVRKGILDIMHNTSCKISLP